MGGSLNIMRKSGKIPGVFYGFKVENTPIEIDYKEFEKIYREVGSNTIIKLRLDDKSNLTNDNILIQDVKRDPVSDAIIHADLYAIRLDKKITIMVPLVFKGISDAVKNQGGILIKHLQELEVETLPVNVPREINVDISVLKTFDDIIEVGSIALPEGAVASQDPEIVIATVGKPKTEEEMKKEFGEEMEAKVEDVKVVKEERKKEEEGKAIAEGENKKEGEKKK